MGNSCNRIGLVVRVSLVPSWSGTMWAGAEGLFRKCGEQFHNTNLITITTEHTSIYSHLNESHKHGRGRSVNSVPLEKATKSRAGRKSYLSGFMLMSAAECACEAHC